MEVGSLTYRYEADFGKVEQQMSRAKSMTESLTKNTQQLASATTNVTKNTADAANAFAKLKQTQADADGTARNLQSTIRELTTGMLGNNIAAIALGTTLGNMALQTLTQLGRNVLQSVDAFAKLRNELVETEQIGLNAGAAFTAIQQAATTSNKSLTELTASYKALAGQVSLTEVGVDNFNQVFVAYQRALGNLQGITIGSSFGQLFDRLASFFADTAGIQNITNQLEVTSKLKTVEDERVLLQEQLDKRAGNSLAMDRKKLDLRRDLAKVEQDYSELIAQRGKIEEFQSAAYAKAMLVTMPQITKELEHQISIGNVQRTEQELLNQLRQVEVKFLQQGVTLNKEDSDLLYTKLRLAQAAAQIQPIRESLRTPVEAETEQFLQRTQALQTFYEGRQDLTEQYNSLMEQEFFRSNVAMLQIAQQQAEGLMQAQNRTFSSLGNVLSQVGQKSKAAAVAALAINTALSVRSAAQNTSVAATRALAELGPIAGPPMAASIEAWGAAEIGMILANGALSLGAAMKGGAIGGGGGGSSGGSDSGATTVDADEPQSFGRAVTINIEGGQMFSTEQVQKLMERMSDEVKQGATLISTKVI